MDRRDFLKGALGASGAVLLGGQAARANGLGAAAQRALRRRTALPSPDQSGIEHFVLVMMENRSFDHMIGWYPGSDGNQIQTFLDGDNVAHTTFDLGGEYMGCAGEDPGHGYSSGRVQVNGGAMDGFLKPGSGNDDKLATGYYSYDSLATARPFNRELALNYTTSDRYFCSVLTSTFPNRMYMHAAASDRLSNSLDESSLPTIWERLDAAGKTGKFYFHDLPTIGLFGADNIARSAPAPDFFVDAALGNLANLSVIDPRFEDENQTGTSGDDHPHADVRAGDAFLADVVHAVMGGPQWGSTVIVICYDEWGGFFDHVAPPRVVRARPDLDLETDVDGNGRVLLGIRTPVYVVSPWSRAASADPLTGGRVVRDPSGVPYDHASILKMVEWRWGLPPLSARDASSEVGNLATALDFSNPNFEIPDLPHPLPPVPVPCPAQPVLGMETITSDWAAFRASDLLKPWRL
jgi:phospholipase C